MNRAFNITMKFATEKKRRHLRALLEAYRAAVNFFICSLWLNPGKLDGATLARLPKGHTRLSERYKSQAQKQALDIVSATRKAEMATGHPAGMPHFKGGAILDAKTVTIEEGENDFDIVIRISSLRKQRRITIPSRKTFPFNKWMSKPGAQLIQGCTLTEDRLTLFIELPDLPPLKKPEEGKILGIDLGVNKLIATSDGDFLGTDFTVLRDKILATKPGTAQRKKLYRERTNYINNAINQLPWAELSVLGIEALHDMKRGKRPDRSKSFRRAMAPWVYRQVITRIEQKAQENRVCLVKVNPQNTSRKCPICGLVSKKNRKGEVFVCVGCGHTADADTNGAHNVLERTLLFLFGSLESPKLMKATFDSG